MKLEYAAEVKRVVQDVVVNVYFIVIYFEVLDSVRGEVTVLRVDSHHVTGARRVTREVRPTDQRVFSDKCQHCDAQVQDE